MSFGPRDLRAQLIEFAAKKLLSKVIDAASSQAASEYQKRVNPDAFQKRKHYNMANFKDRFDAPATKAQANQQANAGRQKYSKDDPVELWVNTVLVSEDGGEPVRILTGRPLRVFNADRDVNTSNAQFNHVNAISNAFVNMLNKDADELNLGESKYYSPKGIVYGDGKTPVTEGGPVPDKGELILAKGIYLQLHREMSDPALEAAAKQDIEAQATESLRRLFG